MTPIIIFGRRKWKIALCEKFSYTCFW